MHMLTPQPLLKTTLQAGLSSLKTPHCYKRDHEKNLKCPVCMEQYGLLAQGLPNAHYMNSVLVCRLSGGIMDERNMPMVLPNGFVYSEKVNFD